MDRSLLHVVSCVLRTQADADDALRQLRRLSAMLPIPCSSLRIFMRPAPQVFRMTRRCCAASSPA